MRACVYGGQYGSEGKGCVSEWLVNNERSVPKLAVLGENGPNSGHSCTKGKVRNIPAASFWADQIILGPDSVVDFDALAEDIKTLSAAGRCPDIFIHQNAAVLNDKHKHMEDVLVTQVSSTGSGSGAARFSKYFYRQKDVTIWTHQYAVDKRFGKQVRVLSLNAYFDKLDLIKDTHDLVFECSQGVLLDTNFGVYPYVTSRSTLPQCALARNFLDWLGWDMWAVYRSYPIRTGGPSGPCAGKELKWEDLGLSPEIATVTKRKRRVFEFSKAEFEYSFRLAPADNVMFTHMDYRLADTDMMVPYSDQVRDCLDSMGIKRFLSLHVNSVMWSREPAKFYGLPL